MSVWVSRASVCRQHNGSSTKWKKWYTNADNCSRRRRKGVKFLVRFFDVRFRHSAVAASHASRCKFNILFLLISLLSLELIFLLSLVMEKVYCLAHNRALNMFFAFEFDATTSVIIHSSVCANDERARCQYTASLGSVMHGWLRYACQTHIRTEHSHRNPNDGRLF